MLQNSEALGAVLDGAQSTLKLILQITQVVNSHLVLSSDRAERK